jgi:hypothetical protein
MGTDMVEAETLRRMAEAGAAPRQGLAVCLLREP